MKQLTINSQQLNSLSLSCCFSGHRFLEKDFSEKLLKKEIVRLIEEENVKTFYCGMAMGFDLIAGETVAKLKRKYPIKLIACIPFYEQDKFFSLEDKKRYAKLLKSCDEQVLISQNYYKGCLLKRNRYMVDNSNFLICYLRKDTGGTAYTVNYFKKTKPNGVVNV